MIFFLLYKYGMMKYTEWSININQLHSLKIGKMGIYIRPPCASIKRKRKEEKISKFFPLIQQQKTILY